MLAVSEKLFGLPSSHRAYNIPHPLDPPPLGGEAVDTSRSCPVSGRGPDERGTRDQSPVSCRTHRLECLQAVGPPWPPWARRTVRFEGVLSSLRSRGRRMRAVVPEGMARQTVLVGCFFLGAYSWWLVRIRSIRGVGRWVGVSHPKSPCHGTTRVPGLKEAHGGMLM